MNHTISTKVHFSVTKEESENPHIFVTSFMNNPLGKSHKNTRREREGVGPEVHKLDETIYEVASKTAILAKQRKRTRGHTISKSSRILCVYIERAYIDSVYIDLSLLPLASTFAQNSAL